MNHNKRLTILQISPFYDPATGGVAGVVKLISEELVRRGHVVTVFTTNRQVNKGILHNRPNCENINGVNVERFPSLINIGYMSICPQMVSKMKEVRADIIHAHSYRHPIVSAAVIIGKKRDIPVVLHGHGPFLIKGHSPFKSCLYKLYDNLYGKKILHSATKIFALTDYEMNNYLEIGTKPTKIKIVPNAFNIKDSHELDIESFKKERHWEDKQIILFLGILDKIKRPDILVKSLPYILKEVKNAYLIFAGPDRGMQKKIQTDIQKYNLEGYCSFVGAVYDIDKELILRSCDILALASDKDAFPLVLLEAMAYGKPIVATKTIGALAIVKDHKTGILVERRDIKGLAKAIIYLLQNKSIRMAYGENARKVAYDCFTVNNIVDVIENEYYELVSK